MIPPLLKQNNTGLMNYVNPQIAFWFAHLCSLTLPFTRTWKPLTSIWVQTQKNHFCKMLNQISCSFPFSAFMHGQCFNQRLVCTAPKGWSKHSTILSQTFAHKTISGSQLDLSKDFLEILPDQHYDVPCLEIFVFDILNGVPILRTFSPLPILMTF